MAHGGDLAQRVEVAVLLDQPQHAIHGLRRLRIVIGPEEPQALGAVPIDQVADGRHSAIVKHTPIVADAVAPGRVDLTLGALLPDVTEQRILRQLARR